MANLRNSNTFYVDTSIATATSGTSGNLDSKNVRITHITVTCTTAGGILTLRDVDTGATKVSIRLATANTSEVFNYADNPMVFPNGINPQTVTNCVASVHIRETSG